MNSLLLVSNFLLLHQATIFDMMGAGQIGLMAFCEFWELIYELLCHRGFGFHWRKPCT